MTYNPDSTKHSTMRKLLRSLGVINPENARYYSRGGTVTKEGLEAARQAVEDILTDLTAGDDESES